jgi:ATP-dependent protease HslVU (ClpYQ) peptidase subunit
MTVAVAVTKNDRTVLAADSLVNFGGQRFAPGNGEFHKIHRVGESLLAWAGWSLYGELLTAHLAADKRRPSDLATEADVFDFFIAFWRAIRADYTFMQRAGDRHPFADLDSTFLLANRHGIFRIAGDMDVSQFRQYSAVGSGSPYALGALRILYEQLADPADIARRAVAVGIEFDVYCGGEIDVAEVSAETQRNR